MRKLVVIGVAVILIAVIAAGAFSWMYLNDQNRNPTPPSLTVEQIRDRAMVYIAANHTETVQLMQSLSWEGGRQDTGLLGSEVYQYTTGGWNVSIQYPVIPNPVYTITATYASQTDSVNWTGTYDGTIKETFSDITVYGSALSTPQQIRDTVMLYLASYHNETAAYMQNIATLPWSGGSVTPENVLGSETYVYLNGESATWTVNIQYPVVLNPVYSVNATYSAAGSDIISWQGTMQGGVIAQTAYKFNP